MEKERRWSDLSVSNRGDGLYLILAQPGLMRGLGKSALDSELMQKIFDQTMALENLTHAGIMLTTDQWENKGKPIHFKNCGGDLKFLPAQPDDSRFVSANLLIVCNKCEMKVGIELSREQVSNVLLHLMIKQIVPWLGTCNFTDCNRGSSHFSWGEQVNEEWIRNLGLISLIDRFGHGWAGDSANEWWALGFMLMPGMNTWASCDGFDNWLRFLFLKKMEQIKSVLEINNLLLRGPKSAKK